MTREDLVQYKVVMKVEVGFQYPQPTPEDLKLQLLVLGEELQRLAELAVDKKLIEMGLRPSSRKDVLNGLTSDGNITLKETDWRAI